MRIIFPLLALVAVAACQQKAETAKPAAAPVAAAPVTGVSGVADTPTQSAMPAGHVAVKAAPVDLGDIKVPKASGPNARTVAEIITKKAELKNKTVEVRGKVVKFNPAILKMNWIHLRDGSGSDADRTNDLVVTTNDMAQVGDVVVVKGVVHVNKDFGMGYSYEVLVEEAKLQK